jgi:transposase
MEGVYERCCGLEVHKRTVVAGVVLRPADGTVRREVRTVGTMTAALLALADWLNALEVQHVALLEATGVSWRPVYTLSTRCWRRAAASCWSPPSTSSGSRATRPTSKMPQWRADPARATASSPPVLSRRSPYATCGSAPASARRCSRKTLVQERAQAVLRVQQVLERANRKLASVATDVLGRSGRARLEALVGGEQDPEALAALARGRLRAKLPARRQALAGRVRPVHLPGPSARSIWCSCACYSRTARSGKAHWPRCSSRRLRRSWPLLRRRWRWPRPVLASPRPPRARSSLRSASLGVGSRRPALPKHLASWAGVCPGNNQSGGKRLSGHTTSGNGWLRAVLGEVAWAISHTSGNYLSAQFHRLARRRGKQKAVVAVAHSVLVILYHMLRDHRPYTALGADYFDHLDRTRLQQRSVRQLERLGYAVTLTPSAA